MLIYIAHTFIIMVQNKLTYSTSYQSPIPFIHVILFIFFVDASNFLEMRIH